ncbi:MAG: hypothetical protein JKP92_08510 [Alphaproteobacteria bacterium]|jgi:hypothetical protein|nr:hypothetical protein [Alphaproteobacteria bacterium]
MSDDRVQEKSKPDTHYQRELEKENKDLRDKYIDQKFSTFLEKINGLEVRVSTAEQNIKSHEDKFFPKWFGSIILGLVSIIAGLVGGILSKLFI